MSTPTHPKVIAQRRQAVLSMLYRSWPAPLVGLLLNTELGRIYDRRELERDLHYLTGKGLAQRFDGGVVGVAWGITSRGVDVLLGSVAEPGIEPVRLDDQASAERCDHCGAPRRG